MVAGKKNGLFRPGPGIGVLVAVALLWLVIDPMFEPDALTRLAIIVAGGALGWLISKFLADRNEIKRDES